MANSIPLDDHQMMEPQMVFISSGSFGLGTSDLQIYRLTQIDEVARKWNQRGYFQREQPYHTIHLQNYYIGKHPVTVREYRTFIDSGGYDSHQFWTKSGWSWRRELHRNHPDFWNEEKWAGDDRLPVVGVSWYEAFAYCQWLQQVTGRVYRLPTEAEWEKSSRGTDERLYPWGNKFNPKYCNTRVSGINQTTSIDHYHDLGDSPYGCADMIGNVSEWTQSLFKPYPYSDKDGRNDVEQDGERVIRGGSWFSPSIRARVNARGMNDPKFSDNDVGFRLACSDSDS
jgi:formylglycine-generating enzyme required for sulfatase activity